MVVTNFAVSDATTSLSRPWSAQSTLACLHRIVETCTSCHSGTAPFARRAFL